MRVEARCAGPGLAAIAGYQFWPHSLKIAPMGNAALM
jgi:hypothetical protein